MLRESPSDDQDAACSAHPTSSGQWNFRSKSDNAYINLEQSKAPPGSPRRGNRWLATGLRQSSFWNGMIQREVMQPALPTRPAQVSGISGAASEENTPSAVSLSPPDAGITGWLCGEVRQGIHQSRAKHLPGSPRRGNHWLAIELQQSPKPPYRVAVFPVLKMQPALPTRPAQVSGISGAAQLKCRQCIHQATRTLRLPSA